MKFLSRLFGNRREMNLTTALERQRLGRTMPGQTGAVAGARLASRLNRFPVAQAATPPPPRRSPAISTAARLG